MAEADHCTCSTTEDGLHFIPHKCPEHGRATRFAAAVSDVVWAQRPLPIGGGPPNFSEPIAAAIFAMPEMVAIKEALFNYELDHGAVLPEVVSAWVHAA